MKKLILVMLTLMLLPVGHGQAQQPITVDRMVIEVWPEFDRPAALVIYSGQVTPDVEAPVSLDVTLPPTAELNAVAYLTQDGLVNATHSQEGDVVTLTTETGLFHIEFYDSAFAIAGQARDYQLTYTADYPINELIWSVQQPPEATDLQTDPEYATSGTDSFGLMAYEGLQAGLAQGEAFTLAVDYTRPIDTLSVEILSANNPSTNPNADNPHSPITLDPPVDTTSNRLSTPLIIGIGLGIGMVVGGLVYFVMTNREEQRVNQAGEIIYCTNCGKPMAATDKFCRSCGEPA